MSIELAIYQVAIPLIMKKNKIESTAPAGSVTTHDINIFPTTRKSIAAMPLASPTPNTAPTNVGEVSVKNTTNDYTS